MIIAHIALECSYTPGFTYQENLLPKYQAQLGHTVYLITQDIINNGDGTYSKVDKTPFIDCGVNVIRISRKHYKFEIAKKLFPTHSFYYILEGINPDLIMLHGMGFSYNREVKNFLKKHSNCKLIGDNHADEFNNKGKKGFLHFISMMIARYNVSILKKYYLKLYGVTEGRCSFIKTYYGVKNIDIDLLPAGVDIDKAHYTQRDLIRKMVRNYTQIADGDFVICSGGKLNASKNIISLMNAVIKLNNPKIHLIIFGKPYPDIAEPFDALYKDPHISYLGWANAEQTYNYFFASDLIVFPGLHSVLWEQAVGSGTPCVFNDLEGLHHFDVGGNCVFINKPNESNLSNLIADLFNNRDKLLIMKNAAMDKGIEKFSYINIAKKSLEVLNEKTF